MKIKEIIKDCPAFPIRWILTTDKDEKITVRERGGDCVVYKGEKSIFEVTDDDIIAMFDVDTDADDKTLLIAIKKIKAKVPKEVLKNIKTKYAF